MNMPQPEGTVVDCRKPLFCQVLDGINRSNDCLLDVVRWLSLMVLMGAVSGSWIVLMDLKPKSMLKKRVHNSDADVPA